MYKYKLYLLIPLITLLLTIIYLFSGIQMMQVEGNSMSPTLEHGSWIVVDTLQIRWRSPKNGDIIVFKNNYDELIVKRIALTPDSPLFWHDNTLYIPTNHQFIALNNAVIDDLSLHPSILTNSIFLLGDNQTNSYDSRFYGAVPIHKIVGRVIAKSHI